MINQQWAVNFASDWISAFNSGDIDKVFALYDDNFSMTSPYIVQRMGVKSGTLVGKENVRPYWQKALSSEPPLEFKLLNVFCSVTSVSVFYESIARTMVIETFEFNPQGKVIAGCSSHIIG
ncbi:nuclear transport factor 2 family protein [uncultured Paraglaciecola sp.]|uniref:nuclear transport factor 2 family protein n=1 Tax=uncultured Paraglaciecola sp. TaxID=1765024 RepID=UPI0030D856A9|tara:strand:+ start:132665 stop:133027 length:363 start_codon:yes stop_codon:yes gene_type:complete